MRDEPGLAPSDLARLLDVELEEAPPRRQAPRRARELSEVTRRDLDAWMERVKKHIGADDSPG